MDKRQKIALRSGDHPSASFELLWRRVPGFVGDVKSDVEAAVAKSLCRKVPTLGVLLGLEEESHAPSFRFHRSNALNATSIDAA